VEGEVGDALNLGWLVTSEPDESTIQAMLTVAPETERWYQPVDADLLPAPPHFPTGDTRWN